MIYKTLYHLDNNDNLRIWFMEQDGGAYRTHSGIQGGKIVVSEWKNVVGKNVGKVNETTDVEQATAEIKSLYQKKLDRKYNEDPADAVRSNFVQPMLADKFNEKKTLKTPKTWYGQPKFDGLRCLTDDKGGTSRAGKPFVTVTHIVDALDELVQEFNATFDGELYNHEYKDDFEKIVSLVKKQKLSSLSPEELAEIKDKVQFHVYDVIMWDNPDADYETRMSFLNGLFSNRISADSPVKQVHTVKLVDPTAQQISDLHDEAFLNGYEGYMLRDAKMPYEFKRSKGLLKYKNFDEDEFTLVEIIEGQGNWSGAAKAVVVRLKDGTTSEAGVAGTYERNKFVFENQKLYLGGDVTIKYQGFTKDGKLRFGVVKAFHEGKRDD